MSPIILVRGILGRIDCETVIGDGKCRVQGSVGLQQKEPQS